MSNVDDSGEVSLGARKRYLSGTDHRFNYPGTDDSKYFNVSKPGKSKGPDANNWPDGNKARKR